MNLAEGATPEASDHEVVRFKMANFMVSLRKIRGLLEVKIQQKIAIWKAESLRNSVLKELAPEEASIAS